MGPPDRPAVPAASAKEDPAGLVLRGRPRPAIRFRRGLIVAVAATSVSALAALAWVALEPASLIASAESTVHPAPGTSPEGIAGAPASYSDVPQLGPPLPGDLGRAIVEQERARGGAGGLRPPGSGSAVAATQKLASERLEARESPVLVRLSRPITAGLEGEGPPAGSPASGPAVGAGSPKQAAGKGAPSAGGGKRGAGLERPRSPWTLAAGTVIPAALVTGLNTGLPGMVVAQVTQDVRDSATGRTVLIPRGARLIGDYDSKVAFGQEREFLAWRRLLFPDGSSVDLGAMPATDAAGFSGVGDKVDFHEWRLVKGVLLSSLLGVGSELGYRGEDGDLVRALRESAQSNGARAGDSIVSRDLDVRPTLTVRPGWPVRAVLDKELVLEPWRGA
jgi:type IV secretion system protein VirB10